MNNIQCHANVADQDQNVSGKLYIWPFNCIEVMMRMNLLFIVLLVLSSCSGRKDNFRIAGTIDGMQDIPVYLYQRSLSGTHPADSAVIDDKGRFALKGFTEQPNFYILFVHKDQYINLIIHPRDRLRIVTRAQTFNRDYFVEGSKDSRLIQKLITKQAHTLDRITELSIEYENNLDRPGLSNIKPVSTAFTTLFFWIINSIPSNLSGRNSGSLVSLMACINSLASNRRYLTTKRISNTLPWLILHFVFAIQVLKR